MTHAVNSSWMAGCILFVFYYHIIFIEEAPHFGNLGEEAPLYWQFIGLLKEKVPFYLVIVTKTMLAASWSVILWSMLYLEGCSHRSSYVIGLAFRIKSPQVLLTASVMPVSSPLPYP